ELRQAKEALAFEVTALTHGVDAARAAQNTAHALFDGEGDLEGVPETAIPQVRLASGVPVVDLLVETGLAASKSAAGRLIQQGGVWREYLSHPRDSPPAAPHTVLPRVWLPTSSLSPPPPVVPARAR